MSSDAKWKGTLAAYDRIKKAQAETAKIAAGLQLSRDSYVRKQTAAYRATARRSTARCFKYARRLLRAGR